MSNRNSKIDKINAYKKMLESKRLPKVDEEVKAGPRNPEDPSTYTAEEQIHMEFTDWAESQLAQLLGEGGPVKPSATEIFDVFSFDQIEVLQKFADRMLMKAGNTEPAAIPTVTNGKMPGPPPQSPGYRPPSNAKPLGNNRTAKANPKHDKATTDYLSKLEKMDRETPEFD